MKHHYEFIYQAICTWDLRDMKTYNVHHNMSQFENLLLHTLYFWNITLAHASHTSCAITKCNSIILHYDDTIHVRKVQNLHSAFGLDTIRVPKCFHFGAKMNIFKPNHCWLISENQYLLTIILKFHEVIATINNLWCILLHYPHYIFSQPEFECFMLLWEAT